MNTNGQESEYRSIAFNAGGDCYALERNTDDIMDRPRWLVHLHEDKGKPYLAVVQSIESEREEGYTETSIILIPAVCIPELARALVGLAERCCKCESYEDLLALGDSDSTTLSIIHPDTFKDQARL